FCCGRLPDTAKLLPTVELEPPMPPNFSDVKFTTPGFSVSSKSKLRPLSGNFSTCCWPTKPDMSSVLTFTAGASASTVRCWLTSPRLRAKPPVPPCPKTKWPPVQWLPQIRSSQHESHNRRPARKLLDSGPRYPSSCCG